MRVVDRCHGDDDRAASWCGACINSYDFYDFVTLSAQQCPSSVDLNTFLSTSSRCSLISNSQYQKRNLTLLAVGLSLGVIFHCLQLIVSAISVNTYITNPIFIFSENIIPSPSHSPCCVRAMMETAEHGFFVSLMCLC
jgi:hypothetical protein